MQVCSCFLNFETEHITVSWVRKFRKHFLQIVFKLMDTLYIFGFFFMSLSSCIIQRIGKMFKNEYQAFISQEGEIIIQSCDDTNNRSVHVYRLGTTINFTIFYHVT